MTVRVYQYPKCSTCRKACKWLDDHGVAYESIDLVATPPSASKLRQLHKQSEKPLAKLFNTSGDSYRAGNFKERLPTMSQDQCFTALASDGKLIKRPLVETSGTVLIGFDEAMYKAAFAKSKPL